MGHGICQVAASASEVVIAYEAEEGFLQKGRERIEKSVSKLVSKGKMSQEDAAATLERIRYTTDPTQLRDVDLVVEAIVENLDLKQRLYKTLADVCQPSTVFASNTSSLSITEMADLSDRPDKFVGLHFFNPVQIMKLVEVIRTDRTAPIVFDRAYRWVAEIGKVAVSCNDTPGFIVNRLLIPNLIQSMLMIDRNDASVKDIDLAMQLGAGQPMGPIHLADYVGLDTCYYIVKGWVQKYPNEPAFVIPKCLKLKVDAGQLGRKTGKGFYYWDGDKRGHPVP